MTIAYFVAMRFEWMISVWRHIIERGLRDWSDRPDAVLTDDLHGRVPKAWKKGLN